MALPELMAQMALSGHRDPLDRLDPRGLPELTVLMVHRDPKEIKETRAILELPDLKDLSDLLVLTEQWDLKGPLDRLDPRGLPEPMAQMVP